MNRKDALKAAWNDNTVRMHDDAVTLLVQAYRWHRQARLNRPRGYSPLGNESQYCLMLARKDVAAGKRRYPSPKIYPAVTWQSEAVANDPIGTWSNPFPRKRERLAHVSEPAKAGLREVGSVMPECGVRNGFWNTSADCGWHTTPDGEVFKDGTGLCYGVVYQLPGRNGTARFVAGYQFGGTDAGPTLDFGTIYEETADWGYGTDPREYDAAYDAARAADSMAESAAEKEREYQSAWSAGSRYAELQDEIAEYRKEALSLLAERRTARKVSSEMFPKLCDAIRDKVETILESISEKREEREKLKAGDYVKEWLPGFYAGERRLRDAFNEGASEIVFAD